MSLGPETVGREEQRPDGANALVDALQRQQPDRPESPRPGLNRAVLPSEFQRAVAGRDQARRGRSFGR